MEAVADGDVNSGKRRRVTGKEHLTDKQWKRFQSRYNSAADANAQVNTDRVTSEDQCPIEWGWGRQQKSAKRLRGDDILAQIRSAACFPTDIGADIDRKDEACQQQ